MTPHDTRTQPPPATAEIPTPQQRDAAVHDLRALGRGPPRRHHAAHRRPRDAAQRADPEEACCASKGPGLPEISEPEIVRHYNRISRRNFDLDTGPYPLGSCTMKHNPRLNEKVAALPGHASPAPGPGPEARPGGAGADVAAGAIALSEICGLPHVSPAAVGRLARRARRAAAHPRLPRGPRRAADQGPDPRYRARHQSGRR